MLPATEAAYEGVVSIPVHTEFSNAASLMGRSYMWRNQTTCEPSNGVAITSHVHPEMAADHMQRAT